MKRSALVLASVVLSVSACSGGSDRPSASPSATASSPSPSPTDSDAGSDPTARSDDDGVEVWDLTGRPSDAAFGIGSSVRRADYSRDSPRPVRFELDGGSIQLSLSDLTFYHEKDVFAFLSRTKEIPRDELATTFRDALEQLDVDTASADAFEADLADAKKSDPGQVKVSYPDEIRFGDWTVAVSAAIAPSVGTGRVSISAGYRPLQTS